MSTNTKNPDSLALEKKITLEYLKEHKIPHLIVGDRIISTPRSSEDFDHTYDVYTSIINTKPKYDGDVSLMILVHDYRG